MRKSYTVFIISFLFFLSFGSSFQSTEIDKSFIVNDLIKIEEDDHCIECENYDYENYDSGIYYLDFDDKSIESTLSEIQDEISERDLNWVAGYNSVFSPDSDNNAIGLGCIIEESENDYENQPVALIYNESLPDEFTWQNVEGVNWITPVQNQLSCGSCVAFGTISALEAVVQIELGHQLNIDLSEAHLFYCGGGSCSNGWTISRSVNYLEAYGVPEESCFPYTPRQTDCDRTCPDWESQAIKLIDGSRIKYSYPPSISKVQEALLEYGPLVTSFTVYSDFFSYNSGIYYQTSDNVAGGHAVAIVGYDNINEYWICKNSWGKGWGENGFFRIGYGECGIGSAFNTYYLSGVYGGICEEYLPSPLENPFPTDKAVNIDLDITLAWNGGDPNSEDKVNYELYFGKEVDNLTYLSTIGPYDSSEKLISYTIEDLESESIYYWQIIAIDSDNSRRIGPLWSFSTIDLNAPFLEIVTPIPGFMYKENGTFRKQIPDYNNIVIFGSINIVLNLFDNGSGVEKVEIYIDNKLKDTVIEKPYNWYWNKFSFGRHKLKFIAYDFAGNKVEESFDAMKIF